jgi:hypothetical protein
MIFVKSSIRIKWTDVLLSVSLSNLCFIRVWRYLCLSVTPNNLYYDKSEHLSVGVPAVMINILMLSVMILCGIHLARYRKFPYSNIVSRLAFFTIVFFCIWQVLRAADILNRNHLLRLIAWFHGMNRMMLFAFLLLGLLFLVSCVLYNKLLAKIVKIAVLISSPLVAVSFVETGYCYFKAPKYPASRPALPLYSHAPAPRVLFMIFDEMDERLSFQNRPSGTFLPEFDRLIKESISANDAHAPGPETLISIPGLISGIPVSRATPAGVAQLLLRPVNSSHDIPWNALDNVFSDTYSLGLTSAIVGWYHPYCRIFSNLTSACVDEEIATPGNSMGTSFPSVLGNQLRSLFEMTAFSLFGKSLVIQKSIEQYKTILDCAKKYSRDPQINLVYVHWPIPHYPYIYDSHRGRFKPSNTIISGYLGNLMLADMSLGEVRRAMEAQNLWDNTTVIVTSDHPWRESRTYDGIFDTRVPFIVKIAGNREPFVISSYFQTVNTRKLIKLLLSGKIQTATAAVSWLKTCK